MHLSSHLFPYPAGQRFSTPIRRYSKQGLNWVISITQHPIFMAMISLRENLDSNLIHLNSTKNAFLCPKHRKAPKYQDDRIRSLPWGMLCPLGKKESKLLLYDTVRAITKACTKCKKHLSGEGIAQW